MHISVICCKIYIEVIILSINKVKNERINITLSKECIKMLDELAKSQCRTRSQQVEFLVRNYLDKK